MENKHQGAGTLSEVRMRRTQNIRKVLLSVSFLIVLISFSVLALRGHEDLWTVQTNETITLINEGKDPAGKASEVWLRIELGGKILSPEKVLAESVSNSGWWSRDDYLLSTSPGDELTISCKVPSDMTLIFESHEYTGKVALVRAETEQSFNFYAPIGSQQRVVLWENVAREQNWSVLILIGVVIAAIWAFITKLLVTKEKLGLIPTFTLSFCGAAVFAWQAGRMNKTYAVILLSSLVFAFVLRRCPMRQMKKYYHGPILALVILFSVYFAFALSGNGLFLMESRMTLNPETISYFVLFCFMLQPVSVGIIALYEISMQRAMGAAQRNFDEKIWKVGLFCGVLVWVILVFFSLGFYPATLTQDGVTHWMQASGVYAFTDDNPVIYSLFIRWLSAIYPSQYTYVLFQITLFAFVSGKIFAFLYGKGISKNVLLVSAVLVGVSPNVFMTLTIMSKNPLFSVLNLWVIVLLIQLIDNPGKYIRKISWVVEMILAMSGLYFIRSNNFPGYYAIVLFFAYLTIRQHKKVRFRLVCVSIASFALIWIVKNPVYDRHEIVHINSGFPYSPIMTPFASARANELELPRDILKDMDQIIPLEMWDERYNPYHSDVYAWGTPRPNYENMPPVRAMKNYFRLLAMYPDVVIKDRLDSVESYWNIFPCTAWRAYNERYFAGIHSWMPHERLPEHLQGVEPNDKGMYFKENEISSLAFDIIELSTKWSIVDAVVWRNGIYIVMILGMFITLLAQKKVLLIWAFLPSVLILATLTLVVGWQLYQYMFFFPIASAAFIACALVSKPDARSVSEKEMANQINVNDKEKE